MDYLCIHQFKGGGQHRAVVETAVPIALKCAASPVSTTQRVLPTCTSND
jgi:hypothetical protein